MREDALVREKTLMDVLKSVTRSDSIETILTCKSLQLLLQQMLIDEDSKRL